MSQERFYDRGFLSRIEVMVKRSLHKDPPSPDAPTVTFEEHPALTPISRPSEGPARLLHGIAYNQENELHPLREISQELFVRGGEIPGYIMDDMDNPPHDLKGMLQQTEGGSWFSEPISTAVITQQVMHEITTMPQNIIPPENLTLKALRRVTADAAD